MKKSGQEEKKKLIQTQVQVLNANLDLMHRFIFEKHNAIQETINQIEINHEDILIQLLETHKNLKEIEKDLILLTKAIIDFKQLN